MSGIRPVFVTRRFWPLMDGAGRTIGNLAAELVARQAPVTVLTTRRHRRWPAEICWHGVSVVRILCPAERRWAAIRSSRAIARWLRRHRDRYDLVYVSGLEYEAVAALSAAGPGVPVVLRAERAGRAGDCLRQLDARGGRRIKYRCMKAAALVGPSRQVHRELIAAGYPRPRIHYLPHGVPIPPTPGVHAKRIARSALAECHSALQLPGGAPLAVYAGQLQRNKGLDELIDAWKTIVGGWPGARLWIAGEGPHRAALHGRIHALGLSDRVVLAGPFDCVDDLLAAADLFVLPSPEEDMSVALLEAMAAGLPIVATDNPGNRDVVADGEHALLAGAEDAGAVAAAIGRLLDQPELGSRLGAAARDRVKEHFPLAKMVDGHVRLFEELTHPHTMAMQP